MKKCVCLFVVLLGCSCRTALPIALPEQHSRDSTSLTRVASRDSVYIDRWHTLVQRGDTVWRTDSVYIVRWRDLQRHDTLTLVQRDSISYPVEVPVEVEKPIPRFYIVCTIALWVIVLLTLSAVVIKWKVERGK